MNRIPRIPDNSSRNPYNTRPNRSYGDEGFKSKYPGTCPRCGSSFSVGTLITKGYDGKYGHVVCQSTPVDPQRFDHDYDPTPAEATMGRAYWNAEEAELDLAQSYDDGGAEIAAALNEEDQRFEVEAYEEGRTPEVHKQMVEAQKLALGTFTVVQPDGSYLTIRAALKGDNSTMAGKVLLSYLNGPDNERSFQACAFINPNGSVTLWKRFRDGCQKYADAYAVVMNSDEDRQAAGEAYALRSGNCYNCGRKLTVPASIHRGLGPDCAAKLGG